MSSCFCNWMALLRDTVANALISFPLSKEIIPKISYLRQIQLQRRPRLGS